ncbi:MAG: hypothetical protein FWD53_02540 [Phycisphaerales bacterium]|nr:hypothetical protein [Phycisphaerales bacterium]
MPPPIPTARQIQILSELCNLPTAPYCEQYVVAWLQTWAKSRKIRTSFDKAGNLYLHYRHSKTPRRAPLVIEAHMDHPGFIATKQQRNGTLLAQFRGGVKPSFFQNARARFFVNGQWHPFQVVAIKKLPNKPFPDSDFQQISLKPIEKASVPPGSIGMWDLPDATVSDDGLFSARVCDDVAGIAAIVCLFEELIAQQIPTHVVGLCSRAEEVGFAGVLAVCQNQWLSKKSPIIGLETSKCSANAPQKAGPIVRVGDLMSTFSPGLTHFIAQAAGHLADDRPFPYQRKLMDGGMCNSTPFTVFGYDAAAMAVPLGNYHNQSDAAPPRIASENIHLSDFAGLVAILVETAKRIGGYKPGCRGLRERLTALHEKQVPMLYAEFRH